jgi:hypothetical protein
MARSSSSSAVEAVIDDATVTHQRRRQLGQDGARQQRRAARGRLQVLRDPRQQSPSLCEPPPVPACVCFL